MTCAENNPHVIIGKDGYMLSADGYLMPAKKDQDSSPTPSTAISIRTVQSYAVRIPATSNSGSRQLPAGS